MRCWRWPWLDVAGLTMAGCCMAQCHVLLYGCLQGAGMGCVWHQTCVILWHEQVFGSKYPESEVTCLALTEATAPSLTVAGGLASGAVYLFRADTGAKGRLQHMGQFSTRPESGDLWAVMALSFAPLEDLAAANGAPRSSTPTTADATSSRAAAGRATLPPISATSAAEAAADAAEAIMLWVVTESQTLSFHVADGNRTILDQAGIASPRCALQRDGRLVVARDDALYEYTPDTRAGCTVFEGEHTAGAVHSRVLTSKS